MKKLFVVTALCLAFYAQAKPRQVRQVCDIINCPENTDFCVIEEYNDKEPSCVQARGVCLDEQMNQSEKVNIFSYKVDSKYKIRKNSFYYKYGMTETSTIVRPFDEHFIPTSQETDRIQFSVNSNGMNGYSRLESMPHEC